MCIVCAVGHVACLFCVCENRLFILCFNYSTAQFHSHSRLFTSLYESKCLMSVSIQALNWFRNICRILTWLRSIKKGSYICTIVHWIAASPEIPKQTFTSSHRTRSVWELHGNLCSFANKKLRTIGFGPPIHIQNTRIFAILHGKCLLQYPFIVCANDHYFQLLFSLLSFLLFAIATNMILIRSNLRTLKTAKELYSAAANGKWACKWDLTT